SRVAPWPRPTHTGSPRASDALRLRTSTDRTGRAAPAAPDEARAVGRTEPRRAHGTPPTECSGLAVPATMSEPLLVAEELEKEYRTGPEVVRVLRGASLDMRPGEIVALVGASGVGKS